MTDDIYYTADLHLGHERIIELCDRPFGSVREMNRELVGRINDVVRRKTLVILGDVLLGSFEESVKLLGEIRAKRILIIPGNHDRFSHAYHHRGSVEVVRARRKVWRAQYEAANPAVRCLPDRTPSMWGSRVAGRKVLLSHYPYVGDSIAGRPDRHAQLRPRDAGLPLIHGHVHGKWREGPGGRMLNVGVDVWDFAPVPETAVREWLRNVPSRGLATEVGEVSE